MCKKRIFYNLSKKDLAISEVFPNFAQCIGNVQYGKVWEDYHYVYIENATKISGCSSSVVCQEWFGEYDDE